MKINVNGGHTAKAPGASKYLDELKCDRAVKNALIADLKQRKHTVSDSTSPDSLGASADLAYQAKAANASGAELAASIHLNSGGGTGVEVWYHTGNMKAQAYAERVAAEIAARLGIRNRGAKPTRNFYWLNNTNMDSILVEVCFVDSQIDAAAYNKHGAAAIAAEIADALVGEKPVVRSVNMQLYRSNSTDAQMFKFEYTGATKVINGRTCRAVRIKNVASGKYVDAAGGKAANGVNLQVHPSNGTDAQLWYEEVIQHASDTYCRYHSAIDVKYVWDVAGASKDDGANIQVYNENGTLAQQFVKVFAQAPDTYYVANHGSGKNLDVVNGGR